MTHEITPQFEMNANKAGVGPQSISNALQTLGDRLTHLHLAHNRLGGVPQIITALSVNSAECFIFRAIY